MPVHVAFQWLLAAPLAGSAWQPEAAPEALAAVRASVARLTLRNANPADGEPFYQLGLCLRDQAFAAGLAPATAQGLREALGDARTALDEFVAYLDKTGVERGIINSQRSQGENGGKPADFVAGNREVARYVEKYKGRFRGSCVVTPFRIEEALQVIRQVMRHRHPK